MFTQVKGFKSFKFRNEIVMYIYIKYTRFYYYLYYVTWKTLAKCYFFKNLSLIILLALQ